MLESDPYLLFHLAVSLVALFLGVGIGHYLGPVRWRTKTETVEVVPPELARLAQNLGITEDVPASQSYGRMIGDLLRERDEERWEQERRHLDEVGEMEARYSDLWLDFKQLEERNANQAAAIRAQRDMVAADARKASARIKAAVDTHDPAQSVPYWTTTTITPQWDSLDPTWGIADPVDPAGPGMPW